MNLSGQHDLQPRTVTQNEIGENTPKAASTTAKKPPKRRLLYMTSANVQENEEIENFLSRDIN